MTKIKWRAEMMGDQQGRVAVVTGANSGIGFETARALAKWGARVVLACRNPEKGRAAVDKIMADAPKGSVALGALDLASLASVRTFAGGFLAASSRLDLLINNAGVMMPPLSKTVDGFELQLGTNHLGHFALTGLLLPALLHTPGSRVINVASLAHRAGCIDFDDLHFERRKYGRWASYGQSKLANLLFTYELQRRLEASGADTRVLAAHPGWSGTNLQRRYGWMMWFNPLLAMKPRQGALPTLFAATSAEARGGEYYGPGGLMEIWGYPKRVASCDASHDSDVARRLFEVSESSTGVRFDLTKRGSA